MADKKERPTTNVNCHKCGWAYSSRNQTCPMCAAPLLLSQRDVIKVLQEYVDLQGIWLDVKEAKKFVLEFKKKFKRLPKLDDLWQSAIQLAKLDEMAEKDVKKLEKDKQVKGKLAVKEKMKQIQDQKLAKKRAAEEAAKIKKEEARMKKEAEKRKKEEEKQRKRAARKTKKKAPVLKEVGAACPSCGTANPGDSKFCLECGQKL